MKYARSAVYISLRLLTLSATLLLANAYADDYSDVSQLMRSGKLPDALTKADQYLAAKPKDPQMRFLKGVIQRDSGKTVEAIATFTRLTEDYPELPEPYNNLAVLYASQSQFDKARAALEMAIRTNPSYSTAHENLGDVYAKLASQAYNKALQLDASNQAVAPKLALIRELFSPTGAKSQRPTLPTLNTAPAAVSPAPPTVATMASKPPPSLPGPAIGKPAPTVATSPSVAAPVTAVGTASVASSPASTSVPAATSTPTPSKPVPSATAEANSPKEAEAAVRAWANAWSSKDVKGYLAAYSRDFDPPGDMKRSDWEDERRDRISSKSKISVKLESLNVSVSGNKAVAKFRQDYKASGLAVSSKKTLELMKNGDHWQIVKESTGS